MFLTQYTTKYSLKKFESRILLSQSFFRNIEENLQDYLSYVPIDKNHLCVYSLKLTSITLETGPVILQSFDLLAFPNPENNTLTNDTDVEDKRGLLQEKEQNLRQHHKSLSFPDYYNFLKNSIELNNAEIMVSGLESPRKTFSTCPPKWWKVYNGLKHDMYSNLKKATLDKTLNIVGSLFWLIHYYSKWLSRGYYTYQIVFTSNLFKVSTLGNQSSLSVII